MRHCHVSQTKEGSILCLGPWDQDWFCHKMELFTLSSQLELKEMRRKRFQRLLFSFFCRFPTKLLGSIYCIINKKTFFSTDFSQDFLASNSVQNSIKKLGAIGFENQSHFWYNNLIQLFQGKYPSCSAWSRHEKSVKNRASQHQRLFSAFFTFGFLGQKQFSQSYFTFNEVDHNHAFCRHTDDLLP